MFVVLVIFAIIGVLTTPMVIAFLWFGIKDKIEQKRRAKAIEKRTEPQKPSFEPALDPVFIDYDQGKDVQLAFDEDEMIIDRIAYLPSSDDIVFYSTRPNSFHERLIVEHLDEIKAKFVEKGRRFIYLPDVNGQKLSKEQICYYNPSASPDDLNLQMAVTYEEIAELYHIPYYITSPCFVRVMHVTDKRYRTSIYQLESESYVLFLLECDYYLKHATSKNYRCYSLGSDEKVKEWLEFALAGESADYRFGDDIYMLSLEIKKNVEQLRAKGIPLMAIKKLVGDISDEPSRLHISKDYKITFLDFNNQELVLSPVKKAVFLLFLNHPEGICFKDLADYKEELLDLYKKVSVYDSIETMENTVNRLIDPMDNSINEKCARIRNALMLMFREEIANWYMIKGKRGESKGIKLPRNLVIREI